MKKDSNLYASAIFFIAWLMLAAILFVAYKGSLSYVVTFNQSKLVARFVGQLSAHTLSDETLAKKTDDFSAVLKTALSDYTKTHHVLVLDSADVIAGQNDITDAIGIMVAERMKGLS